MQWGFGIKPEVMIMPVTTVRAVLTQVTLTAALGYERTGQIMDQSAPESTVLFLTKTRQKKYRSSEKLVSSLNLATGEQVNIHTCL